METNNSKKEDYEESVRKIVENAISLQETDKTRIVGGRVGSDDYSFSFYNPHNARFYFNFNKWNFKPTPKFNSINAGHELELESFFDCRIVVKKSKIEITNRINSIRKFTISGSDRDRLRLMEKAGDVLELESIDVLKRFISEFGGTSDFVCISRRIFDNKILHDEVIDSIPNEVQWNDDVSKKLYNENSKTDPKNVEFKKESYGQNYVRNAGLRLFAPEIADRLSVVDDKLNVLSNDFKDLTHENKIMAINMTSHIPLVQKATEKLEQDSLAVNSLVKAVNELKEVIVSLKPKEPSRKDRIKQLKEDFGW